MEFALKNCVLKLVTNAHDLNSLLSGQAVHFLIKIKVQFAPVEDIYSIPI